MPQALTKNLIHLVFSTKLRQPLIDAAAKPKLHAYLSGIFDNLNSHALRTGGTVDHVHILFNLSKTQALSTVVQEVKQDSSKWMKQYVSEFYWQSGYGAFSIGESTIAPLCAYIDGQEEHHRKTTFEEEFRKLCVQYNVELNEKYVWD